MGNSVNTNTGLTLSNFEAMFNHAKTGDFSTGVEKTKGQLYLDSSGKLQNANRHWGTGVRSTAEQNVALRKQLVSAFSGEKGASDDFIAYVTRELGLAKPAEAAKPLDRRTVKQLLIDFKRDVALQSVDKTLKEFELVSKPRIELEMEEAELDDTYKTLEGYEIINHDDVESEEREELVRARVEQPKPEETKPFSINSSSKKRYINTPNGPKLVVDAEGKRVEQPKPEETKPFSINSSSKKRYINTPNGPKLVVDADGKRVEWS